MSESEFEPVHGTDAAWLKLDRSTNHMVITAMAVLDPVSHGKLKDVVEHRFLAFHQLLKRPQAAGGLYFWERNHSFDWDYHLRRAALPAPADKSELTRFLSVLQSTPLDPHRPLWQFFHIENYGTRHVVILRIHHCYADGLALAAVFGSMSDASPNVDTLAFAGTTATRASEASAGVTQVDATRTTFYAGLEKLGQALEKCTQLSYRLTEEGRNLVKDPSQIMNGVRLGLNGAAELARLAALPTDNVAALRQPLGLRKSCSWSEQIPLLRFKEVARKFQCSVNDVLLACVSGGFREEIESRSSISDRSRLHATLPVNLRPLETLSGREQLQELGNQFGMVFVQLAVQISNPIERLYKVKHDMLRLKESTQPVLSHALLAALGILPHSAQETLLELFSNKTSLVLSNVPTARTPRYLAGSQIRELMFWVPQAGDIGTGVSLLSYNQHVQIGINADREALPDPGRVVEAIVRCLDEYSALCGNPVTTPVAISS